MTDTAGLIAEARELVAHVTTPWRTEFERDLTVMVSRLAAALVGGGEGAAWHDLTTLPREGDRVLTSSLGYVCIGTREHQEFFNMTGDRLVQVDHWADVPRGATDSLGVPYPTPQPPHTERDGGEENAETILAYLNEAEVAWRAARDSSGYGQSSAWAMEHGRKLIFGWRRAAQDALAAHPTPPGPVAGWRNIAEPLGCPTPGACMCPKPVQTRENLARSICRGMWPDHAEMYERNGDVRWADCLRAAEALSALPPEPPVESGEAGE